jgi:hypothetical protein
MENLTWGQDGEDGCVVCGLEKNAAGKPWGLGAAQQGSGMLYFHPRSGTWETPPPKIMALKRSELEKGIVSGQVVWVTHVLRRESVRTGTMF